jgi:hypothetical protein
MYRRFLALHHHHGHKQTSRPVSPRLCGSIAFCPPTCCGRRGHSCHSRMNCGFLRKNVYEAYHSLWQTAIGSTREPHTGAPHRAGHQYGGRVVLVIPAYSFSTRTTRTTTTTTTTWLPAIVRPTSILHSGRSNQQHLYHPRSHHSWQVCMAQASAACWTRMLSSRQLLR